MQLEDLTPRARIEQACRSMGTDAFVGACEAAVAGGRVPDHLVSVIGGAHGSRLLRDGVPEHQRYWLRVWGARGLLWSGPGQDVAVLRRALADDAWRVREMVCKVVARHLVGDLLEDVAGLVDDPVDRVRSAAARAVARVSAAGV